MTISKPFAFDFIDDEISARMPETEWARVVDFRRRPNFLGGLVRYHELIPPYFTNNLLLNKVVTEAKRFEMLVYALYLYDARNMEDPRSGLTLANLQKLCVAQNVASPGRVRAILGIMQLGGYLTRQRSKLDSRVVHFAPTQRFMTIVEGWNRAILQVIDTVDFELNLTGQHERLPRFGWDMRRKGAEKTIGGWHLLDAFHEVDFFVSSDGGWMLLLHCVGQSFRAGQGVEIAPISVDLTDFGKRFGVSRSHLRRLLEAAHQNGLLDSPPYNGANIVLGQRLLASFLTCMARELVFYRDCAMPQLLNS